MTRKYRRMTAAEFVESRANDLEYQRMVRETEARMRANAERYAANSRPILDRLAAAGYPADSIQAATHQYAPLPDDLTQTLLESIDECGDEDVLESVVRSLGAAADAFDGRRLAELYDSTSNEGLKFAILNTIALTHPLMIDTWLEERMRNAWVARTLSNLGLSQ